jgi:predicted O-methyltransferase YrrM
MLDDKKFLDITRGTSNPGREELPAEIATYATDTSDMRQNLPILYGIVAGMGAQRVLEIGTSDGTSTLALLKAVSETGGRLTSIDIVDVPVAQALVEKYGLAPHWTFLKGDSFEVLTRLRAEQEAAPPDAPRDYDVILVDADHTRAGATRDFAEASKMLRKGGVIFTHDNWMASSDHDFSKPFGQRAIEGCAFLGHELLIGDEWVGVVFPFNCNLGVFRRKAECVGEIAAAIDESRKLGLLT